MVPQKWAMLSLICASATIGAAIVRLNPPSVTTPEAPSLTRTWALRVFVGARNPKYPRIWASLFGMAYSLPEQTAEPPKVVYAMPTRGGEEVSLPNNASMAVASLAYQRAWFFEAPPFNLSNGQVRYSKSPEVLGDGLASAGVGAIILGRSS